MPAFEKGKPITDPIVLERLAKAREKAMETRKLKAQQKKDENLVKTIEEKKKRTETQNKLKELIDDTPKVEPPKYEDVVVVSPTNDDKRGTRGNIPPPEPEPEPEPEIEYMKLPKKEKAKKKKKKVVIVESDSSESEEEEVVYKKRRPRREAPQQPVYVAPPPPEKSHEEQLLEKWYSRYYS